MSRFGALPLDVDVVTKRDEGLPIVREQPTSVAPKV